MLATAGLGEGAVLVAVCLGVAGGCFSCGAGCWAALLNSVCWNWSGRRILWELVSASNFGLCFLSGWGGRWGVGCSIESWKFEIISSFPAILSLELFGS